MENPLTLPESRRELMALAGRGQRKDNRQREDERILRVALSIFKQHLPEMLMTPPKAERFSLCWPQIDEALRQGLRSEKAYRFAYSFIGQRLEAGNRLGIWLIEVPAPYINLRRHRPTRTIKRQLFSRGVAEAEANWLANATDVATDIKQLFSRMLLSMVLYGGLNRPSLWSAVGTTLKQAQPLRGNIECCWLHLSMTPSQQHPSNLYQEDPKTHYDTAHCQVLYMPDPISLGLLRQFIQQKPQGWRPPQTSAEYLQLLNTEIGTTFSNTELVSGGIYISEQQPGISLPQVLVEYAAGRQPSASLPWCYWQRLLQPQILSCTAYAYTPFTRFPPLLKRDTLTARKTQPSLFLLTQLRDVFRQDPARPRNKRAIITELRSLKNDELLLPEALLLNWLLTHLDERGNAVSTAKRYLNSIGSEWLLATDEQELSSYSSEDFYDLYLSILNRPRSQRDREYRAGRLEDMHSFAAQHYALPPLAMPLQASDSSIVHISSAIIDEPLFNALLNQFDAFKDIDEYQSRMLKCFLTMAYRTGLRPGELAKLRLMDIEPSPVGWLFVRNNKHGNNKTEAALRKVPLFPLLTESEGKLVNSYLGERRMNSQRATELLFHQPENVREPLDTMSLSIAVKSILKDLSGGLYYRLYHLRHSALSRLQLLLHHDQLTLPAEVDALLPYDEHQRHHILQTVAGTGRLRDRYHALAAFAGHSSPEISVSTYLHFTDFLLGLYLQQNNKALTAKQAQVLLGLRPYRVSQLNKNGKVITPADTAHFLRKRLSPFIKKPKRISTKEQPEAAHHHSSTTQQSHYHQAIAVLNRLQAGHNYQETAWFYRLTAEQIEKWHQSALALRSLTTEKNLPRLFPRSRRHQLLPPDPVGVAEMRDLAVGLKRCRELYASATTKSELIYFIRYTLTHCNSSRSGIKFDGPASFQRFMAIASQVFDEKRWRLSLRYTDQQITQQWQCGSVEIVCYPMKQQARFSQGSGWLQLRHREEKKRQEADKLGYSSHSLRILLHRLAIILFTADEISTWQAADEYVAVQLSNSLNSKEDQ